MTKRKLELIGRTFGHITITGRADTSRSWIGTCDCNAEVHREFNGSRLNSGVLTHCGCQRARHGHTKGKKRSPTYISWQAMKARSAKSKYIDSDGQTRRTYGYDIRWKDFEFFLAEMGEAPPKHTLDRINVLDGRYCKPNCRWASRAVQDHNKTNTKLYYADPESRRLGGSALEWAEWYSRSAGVTMSVAEFHNVIKFITPEQLFCALSPLSTFVQLQGRIRENKTKKFAAMWAQVEELPESDDFIANQLEEAGYVSDAEFELLQAEKASKWDGGEALAKKFYSRLPNDLDDDQSEENEDTGYVPE